MPNGLLSFPEARDNLLIVLERVPPILTAAAERGTCLRFPAQSVANPALRRLLAADGAGLGAQPPRDSRACLYDLASSWHQLDSFRASNAIVCLDHIETIVFDLQRHRLSLSLGLLRGLMERIAVARSVARKTLRIQSIPDLGPANAMQQLIEIFGPVRKALYGTKRDWVRLTAAEFSDGNAPAVDAYRLLPGFADMGARHVLSYID